MFHYFPDSYMWSHAMLLGLGAIPWGGGEIGEIDQVGARLKDKVGDYTAWHDEWLAMANRVRQLARDAEAKGRRETGRETYLRACNYYNLAERFAKPGSANKIETYRQGLECFTKAAALFDPPIERVRVPYEGSFLPAYFLPAEGRKTSHLAPTVVFFDGLDASKEQLYLLGGRQLVKHGMNCLIVDGPGNGEALAINEIYLREDYERPAGAAIDYLETRSDVDAERIGILAISLGGYFAPRAAAFEPRIKACAAWGAQWDYQEIWRGRIAAGIKIDSAVPSPLFQIEWMLGVSGPDAVLAALEGFKLAAVAPKVACPFLLVHGADDAQIPLGDAEKLFAAIGSRDKTFVVLTEATGGSAHCQLDNFHMGHYHIFDWLAEKLGG